MYFQFPVHGPGVGHLLHRHREEKESDTWTLLLATPVSGRTIVWGKALGVLRRLLWPAALIAGHFLIFAAFRVISFTAAFSGIWIILSFNTVWVATGVYFSLRMAKVTTAVINNFSLALIVYLGVMALLGTYTALIEQNDILDVKFLTALPLVLLTAALAWLSLAILLMIRRPKGAMVQLMLSSLATLVAAITVAAQFNWIDRRNIVTQVGWYTPFYFLADMRWSVNSTHVTLPDDTHVDGVMTFICLFGLGCLHLLLSAGILALTSWKFSALVGRARKQKSSRRAWRGKPVPHFSPQFPGF